ncbi:MAG: transposase [Planctomycetes bacterium]|nr:transposase [Planctomycetota bacterium]
MGARKARRGASENFATSGYTACAPGRYGTFHHVSKKHLQRYVDEFVFRYKRGRWTMERESRWRSAVRMARG